MLAISPNMFFLLFFKQNPLPVTQCISHKYRISHTRARFKHALYINNTFMSLNDSEKNHFIFTNNDITYKYDKTCNAVLTIRRNLTINERF